MNISTRDKVYFLIYLRSITHEGTKLGQLIDICKDNNFQESFLNLATYSITNFVRIPVFHFFGKVNEGQLKMVNVNYSKWPDLAILSF